MALLSTVDIVAGYNTANVLRGINLNVQEGEMVGVVGRNGVGKTTLMKTIMGLLPLRKGQVHYKGRDIGQESADARARFGIGYVPQGRGIFPQLSVKDNLRMGGFINTQGPEADLDRVMGYFPFLKERLQQRGGTLSGGQQAMLAIARALVREPDLLLLDEPSDGVQPSIVEEIGEFLKELNGSRKITVLIVEQNVDLMVSVAQRAYAMDKGLVTAEISGEELKNEMILATHVAV